MTKKRELDLKEVARLRDAGNSWQDVGQKLGWNVSALRERLRREGYQEKQKSEKKKRKAGGTTSADGLVIDWEAVRERLAIGCQAADVAGALGVNVEYLANRFSSWERAPVSKFASFVLLCRAEGRCRYMEALAMQARKGDKSAAALIKEALKDGNG